MLESEKIERYSASMDVSQIDIARELKISVATVSKALRNHPDIRPQTRAQILDVASRMGYRPPVHGRGPKTRKKGQRTFVGVLCFGGVPDHPNDFAGMRMLAGLSEAAESKGVSLLVRHLPLAGKQILEGTARPAALLNEGIEGLVLIHRCVPEAGLELSNLLPCVSLVHYIPGARMDLVDVDCRVGMAELVERLAKAGHNRIGFVGLAKEITFTVSRCTGYLSAMLCAGLPVDKSNIIEGLYSAQPQNEIMTDQVMARTKAGVTAWVCDCDATAYWLCRQLTERGINIPRDVSITGFDGWNLESNTLVVDSIRPPFEEMGAVALEVLTRRMENSHGAPRHILIEGRRVAGKTIAPPQR